MKKIALLAAVIATFAIGFAQTKPAAPKAQTEIACPVMPKNKVNIAKATKNKMFADYNGRRYFFCCAGCPEAFKKDPKKYAKSASIPTPKVKKK